MLLLLLYSTVRLARILWRFIPRYMYRTHRGIPYVQVMYAYARSTYVDFGWMVCIQGELNQEEPHR